MQDDVRIRDIQSKVEAGKTRLSALDSAISDPGLRQRLQQASFWLQDVENLFLRSARQEHRSPETLSRWLIYAEIPLQMAMQRLKELEEIVAKFGSAAQTI